jgi:hypothetical protein
MVSYSLRKIPIDKESYPSSPNSQDYSAKGDNSNNYENLVSMKIQDYVIRDHNQRMKEISFYNGCINGNKQSGHGDYSSKQSFVLAPL